MKTLLLLLVTLAGAAASVTAQPAPTPTPPLAPAVLPTPQPQAVPRVPSTPLPEVAPTLQLPVPFLPALPADAVSVYVDVPAPPEPPQNPAPFALIDNPLQLAASAQGLQRPQLTPRFRERPEEGSYDQARTLIERDQYERALSILDRLIENAGPRTDAAMYWKAYSLSKLSRKSDALAVLNDLEKQFPKSAWRNDARALDVEIRQASGQSVSADAPDDEVKLLALRGMMQSDPETTLPILEKLLAGNSSVLVKDRALFVLGQSRAARAREVLANVARRGPNPDLQVRAIRYLGMRSDQESRQVLADVYASTDDTQVKRTILRSFMIGNARDRLLNVAKSEKLAELRGEAIQQLGVLGATTDLDALYRNESDREVKQRIIDALSIGQHAPELVALARAEKNPDLKKAIVLRLSTMKSPEAREYMLELLK